MGNNPTFGHAQQILKIVSDQNPTDERLTALLKSGLLSDLVKADPSKIDRAAFRAALTPKAEEANPTDTIIRVDRSIRPVYPDWVKDVLHPELELSGPSEFDLAKTEQWLHPQQKNGGRTKGEVIYEHLKSDTMLDSCFNLADLLAIKAKGVKTFRAHFADKAVFAWKSIVRHRLGDLRVPYLVESVREVVVYWHWLGNDWRGRGPALRLASQNSTL